MSLEDATPEPSEGDFEEDPGDSILRKKVLEMLKETADRAGQVGAQAANARQSAVRTQESLDELEKKGRELQRLVQEVLEQRHHVAGLNEKLLQEEISAKQIAGDVAKARHRVASQHRSLKELRAVEGVVSGRLEGLRSEQASLTHSLDILERRSAESMAQLEGTIEEAQTQVGATRHLLDQGQLASEAVTSEYRGLHNARAELKQDIRALRIDEDAELTKLAASARVHHQELTAPHGREAALHDAVARARRLEDQVLSFDRGVMEVSQRVEGERAASQYQAEQWTRVINPTGIAKAEIVTAMHEADEATCLGAASDDFSRACAALSERMVGLGEDFKELDARIAPLEEMRTG